MSIKAPRGLLIYAIIYLLFLYAPILLLPLFAFNSSSIIALPLSGFTIHWFALLLETEALHEALYNSLLIAFTTAIVSTILGIFAARAAARYEFPGKRGIVGFIMVPLVLPEIIIGVALIVVLIQLGMPLSAWTVIIGHVLICTPFSIAILQSAFNNMDRSLEEASMDLGENKVSTFFRVILPLVTPGIISSLLISFTISLDEFIIAFFLTGTDTTLPVYIWSQLRFPARLPAIMALGFIMVLLSLILLLSAEYFRRRANRIAGNPQSSKESIF
ncbi:ABC transporter permease [Alphaproteobacteria bacterium]|jgi:spermidine/putrescine transport system permease protein|nr:ABC transporter permease [Alphaproteobacteria bacterium]